MCMFPVTKPLACRLAHDLAMWFAWLHGCQSFPTTSMAYACARGRRRDVKPCSAVSCLYLYLLLGQSDALAKRAPHLLGRKLHDCMYASDNASERTFFQHRSALQVRLNFHSNGHGWWQKSGVLLNAASRASF